MLRPVTSRPCPLDIQAGYAIRFENVSSKGVIKLQFCTDGVLQILHNNICTFEQSQAQRTKKE